MRISLLFAVACGGTATLTPTPAPSAPTDPVPAEHEDPSELVRYSLTWDQVEQDQVAQDPEVQIRLAMDLGFIEPAPSSVVLLFAPLELRDGSSSGVRFLSTDDGEVDLEASSVTVPVVDGRVRASYRVRLEHHRHDPLRGIDNVPHPTRGGFTVPGVALFPTFMRLDDGRNLDGEVALAVALPAGWRHVHGAAPRAGDPSRAHHLADFARTIHAFGRYEVQTIERGESLVRVVSADWDEAGLAPLRELIARTLDLGTSWLGPTSPGTLTIVVDRVGERYEGGLVGTQSIVLSGPDLGSLRAHEMPGLIVVHELAHLWARADTMWLNEGLARMLEIAMGVHLEDLGPEDALAEVERRVDRYYELAGTSRAVRADEVGAWPYDGGLAVLVCVEAALRANDESLLQLHRELRERNGLPVSTDAFRTTLDERVAGLGDRLGEWLSHAGPIDLAPCYEGLGFEAENRPARRLTPRAFVVDVLGARGLEGTTVTAVGDDPKLELGDRILAVDGQSVASLDSILYRIGDARRVTLRVRRSVAGCEGSVPDVAGVNPDCGPDPRGLEEEVEVVLRLGRLGADAYAEVPRVHLAPGDARGRLLPPATQSRDTQSELRSPEIRGNDSM